MSNWRSTQQPAARRVIVATLVKNLAEQLRELGKAR